MVKPNSPEFKSFLKPLVTLRKEEERKRKERENYLKYFSLDGLVEKAANLQEMITTENNKGVRASSTLDNLYSFNMTVENALQKRLFAGEKLRKPLNLVNQVFSPKALEYVFSNFHMQRNDSDPSSLVEEISITPSAIKYLPNITDFVNAVGSLKGQLALLTESSSRYGNENHFELNSASKGVIANAIEFRVNKLGTCHHHEIFLPLDNFNISGVEGWTASHRGGISIQKELVRKYSQVKDVKETGINLDYTNGPYLGGTTAYAHIDLMLGDNLVRNRLSAGLSLRFIREEIVNL